MASFALIRPKDDGPSRQASDWADQVETAFLLVGHSKLVDLDNPMLADNAGIVAALGCNASLICYFGHGTEWNWLTNRTSTVGASDFTAAAKAIVSIACKTGCNLGPDAVTAGVKAWLGFTIKVGVIAPHGGMDPIGEAIVAGVTVLGLGQTMQQCRDEMYSRLDQVVQDSDIGKFSTHPGAGLAYFVALAMRDHLALHGTASHRPL